MKAISHTISIRLQLAEDKHVSVRLKLSQGQITIMVHVFSKMCFVRHLLSSHEPRLVISSEWLETSHTSSP